MAQENYFAKKRREREAAQGRVQLTPPDPKLPHETRKSANEARASDFDPAQSAANVRKTNIEADRTRRLTPYEIREKAANAEKAEREARRPSGEGLKRQQADSDALADLRSVAKQMNRVQELYNQDLKGSGIGSIGEYLPTPRNRRFDSQAGALATLLKPLIRGPGEGTWTDADQRLLDRLVPSSWAPDIDNEERFETIKRLVGERAAKHGGTAGREPVGGGAPALDKRVLSQVDAMIDAGVPLEAINAALGSQNLGQVDPDHYARAREWKQKNPGQRYTGAVEAPPSGYGSSPLSQGLSGANEGLAAVLGAPVDLVTGALNAGASGINALAGTNIPSIDRPFLGSEQIKDGLRAIGSIGAPNSDGSGQFIRRVGQSAGAAAIPLGGAATTLPRLGAQLLAGVGGGVGGATAQAAFPGNPVAELAGEVLAGGASAGGLASASRRHAQRQLNAAVPTVDQLKQQASELYRAAESRGVAANPQQTQQLADNFKGALTDEGRISPTGRISEVYPKAKEAAQLVDDYAGKPMSPTQIQSVRKVISDGLTSQEPAERRLAGVLTESFDNFANPLAPELKDARNIASRYLTAEQLERARELAGARASQFTGSGFENALRTEYRGLDRASIKGNKFFSEDVNNAIEKVARGTPTSNFLRGIGRLAPTGPVSGMGSIVPGLGVASLVDPVTGGMVGLGLAGAGAAGRAGATHMGIRAADQAELVARNGGNLPEAKMSPELAALLRRLALAESTKYLPQ